MIKGTTPQIEYLVVQMSNRVPTRRPTLRVSPDDLGLTALGGEMLARARGRRPGGQSAPVVQA